MEKKYLLTVSEVAKILNVNKNTILHYDQEGLVTSIRMDNNYRYYHEGQIEIFKIILNLRKVGFSIKEIRKMKDYFKYKNYTNTIEMIKEREEQFEKEKEELEKGKKALISHKHWLEYLNDNLNIDFLNSEIFKKENGLFCIKSFEEEKAIFIKNIDVEKKDKNTLFKYVSQKLDVYNYGKEWWKKYIFGYVISKNNFEKLEYKKSKIIIKVNIELYPDKYIFSRGKYAIFYVPIDIEEQEAIKEFYLKINKNGYKINGDLYIENLFIFGSPDIKRSKIKVLKTLVTTL